MADCPGQSITGGVTQESEFCLWGRGGVEAFVGDLRVPGLPCPLDRDSFSDISEVTLFSGPTKKRGL
jgi:hypothetical protein